MAYAFTPSTAQRLMRNQINKLTKGHSVKAERRFCEILKRNHIPFRTKVMIGNHEVDFLVGDYAIEIDGHPQNVVKNMDILRKGYNIIHFYNWEVTSPLIEKWLKQTWQAQVSQRDTPQSQDS